MTRKILHAILAVAAFGAILYAIAVTPPDPDSYECAILKECEE